MVTAAVPCGAVNPGRITAGASPTASIAGSFLPSDRFEWKASLRMQILRCSGSPHLSHGPLFVVVVICQMPFFLQIDKRLGNTPERRRYSLLRAVPVLPLRSLELERAILHRPVL